MTLEQFHKANDWIYLDNIDELPSVKAIYCDTRDFGITVSNESPSTDPRDHPTPWTGKYLSLINNPKCKSDFLIEKSEILKFLKLLETISGGKNDWRCLVFKNKVSDRSGWDYKYIRFYQYECDPNKYIVTGSYGTAIHWKDLNADTIGDPDVIYAHSEYSEEDNVVEVDLGSDKGDWTGFQTNDPKLQIGFKFRPTFDSCIDHFEVRGFDIKSNKVLTKVYPKSGSSFDDEIEYQYYLGAFEIKDYVEV